MCLGWAQPSTHLGIRDCGISIVVDGVQHSFHASSNGDEPTDMTIGPFNLSIVDPCVHAGLRLLKKLGGLVNCF